MVAGAYAVKSNNSQVKDKLTVLGLLVHNQHDIIYTIEDAEHGVQVVPSWSAPVVHEDDGVVYRSCALTTVDGDDLLVVQFGDGKNGYVSIFKPDNVATLQQTGPARIKEPIDVEQL